MEVRRIGRKQCGVVTLDGFWTGQSAAAGAAPVSFAEVR